MTYFQFLEEVQNRTDLYNEMQASTAVTAALNTLAERLSPEERENLSAQLPNELKDLITINGEAQEFGLDEFFERVSQRMETEREEAEYIADQIISILSEAITEGEIDDIKEKLPEEYRELFETPSK